MIGTIAAGTVTRPITAGVTVLLYVDMRMRKEGLDLALRTASGTGQPGAGQRGQPGPAAVRGRLRQRVAAAVSGPGARPPAPLPRPRGPRRRGDLRGAGPLTGRGTGQRLARAELSKAIYHPHQP